MLLANDHVSSELYQSEIEDKLDSLATIYVGFAGFTILVWDHIVTFGDEVEIIWKRPKTLVSILFLINRYLTPLGFIVFLVAFLDPTWTPKECEDFIRYQGAMVSIGIQIVGLMMLKRVSALFQSHRWVIYSVASIFLVWVGTTAYLLAHGIPVEHTAVVHSCTMVFDTSSVIASSSAWLPLLYDTVIIGLVVYRTIPYQPAKNPHTIARTLVADGMLYYTVIFAVNITLTVMIAVSPDGLKNIGAQLELHLTVAMMSRITLHLPKAHHQLIGMETHSDSRVRPIVFAGFYPHEEGLMASIMRMKPIRPLSPSQMAAKLREQCPKAPDFNSLIPVVHQAVDGTGSCCASSTNNAKTHAYLDVEDRNDLVSSHSPEPTTVDHCDCKMCIRRDGTVDYVSLHSQPAQALQ